MIFLHVQHDSQDGCDNLSANGSNGGAGYAHLWHSQKPEDQDGVQDDVDDGAQPLGQHGVEGSARSLQQLFKGHLQKQPDGADGTDLKIGSAVIDDFRNVCLQAEKDAGENAADEGKGDEAA